MKRALHTSRALLVVALVVALTSAVWAAPNKGKPDKPLAKNVILMISDGCGYNQIIATDYYQYGRVGRQVYERFPFEAAMSTFSLNCLTPLNPLGYDPLLAWANFTYIMSPATDSASAGTAMSTGVKTLDGVIGKDKDGNDLFHAFQRAEQLGKGTGVVTSVEWTHATPASFVAHNASRNNYAAIGQEMINVSTTDVIMGCGNPEFDDNGQAAVKDPKYVGGTGTWAALKAGSAGAHDLNGDGVIDVPAWTLIQTRAQFQALMQGPTPPRVCGTAQVHTTLQQARSGADADKRDDAPYEVPLTPSVPTLAEMSLGALNVLDNFDNGFCLMIEGGAVDWTCHANEKGRTIEEEIDFNGAVEAVVDWVQANSNWGETLLIVTGDHETGHLWGGTGFVPIVNNGPGVLPGMQFNSGSHTNALLPIFAKGDASRLLRAAADQQDAVRGWYLDNTEVADTIFTVIK